MSDILSIFDLQTANIGVKAQLSSYPMQLLYGCAVWVTYPKIKLVEDPTNVSPCKWFWTGNLRGKYLPIQTVLEVSHEQWGTQEYLKFMRAFNALWNGEENSFNYNFILKTI
jgi:hypothetical protein